MLTDTAPHARLVVSRQLLIKSSERFAHSGKHALYGNPPRWHLITPNKPAPKGAPIAHDPGAIAATPHQLADEQVAQLKLPESNTNAPSFNKQIDKLVGFASTGNAAAILGMQFGTNTYSVKAAKVANFLLQQMGVHEHVVAHGQKAGTHAALQSVPAALHPSGLPEHLAPKTTPDLQESGPLAPLAEHVKDTLDAKAADGDTQFLQDVAKNNPEHPQIVAYAKQKLAELDAKSHPPAPPAPPVPPTPKAKKLSNGFKDTVDGWVKNGEWDKIENASAPDADDPLSELEQAYFTEALAKKPKPQESAPAGPLSMPAFDEGKTTTGVVDYYQKAAQKVIDHGHAGNAAVLEDMKAAGLKPNAKGKVSNTWAGKTANSKKLLALHAAALAHAKGGSAPADDNGPKEGDTKPAADGGTLVLKDGHWVKQGEDASPHDTPVTKVLHVIPSDDAKANYNVLIGTPKSSPGSKFSVLVKDGDSGQSMPTVKVFTSESAALQYAHALAAGKNPYADVSVPTPAAAPATATGSLTSQQLSNLQSIPWFKLKLPAENTNAKSHNGALAKIEAMAFSGDTAGLQAFIDAKGGAKQTYAKKQVLTAQTALAGLGTPGATAAVPVTPVPSAPAGDLLVNGWKAAISAGKAPTKEQAEAYDALSDSDPDAAMDYFADAVNNLIPADNIHDDSAFDGAFQEANAKAHELHGLGLAGKSAPEPANAPAAAAPAPPAPAAKQVQVKSVVFHNTTAGHNKFWSASIQGSTLKTMYGKNGTKGQQTIKEYGSPAAAVAAYQKLIDEKKAKGYQYQGQGVHLHDAPASSTQPQGPKEGDTKQGADGMLVLKDGHWVKVGGDGMGRWSYSASNPGLSGAPSLEYEDFYVANGGDDGFEFGYLDPDNSEPDAIHADTLAEVIAHAKAKGHPIPPDAALKKLDPAYKPAAPAAVKKLKLIDISTAIQVITPGQTKFSNNLAGKLATAAAKGGNAAGIIDAHAKALHYGWDKTASHIAAVAQLMGVTIPAAGATPAAATPTPASPAATPGAHPSMDAWAQVGPQGGSNPGGKFRDPSGQEWYCKFPADEATARSEILAAKLYGLAGLSGQDAMLVTKNGKVGIATKWVNIKKATTAAALAKVEGVHSGFAVDAWLANWDVVGLSLDNLQVGPDGKAHRVDAGGSLEYRAQGDKKPFGHKVDEIDTLRDAAKNPKSAAVFAKMTEADLIASASKVAAISDVTIRAMVNQHGPGDAAAKKTLADTLIARKADLLKRFPQAAKKKKAIVFHPEKISEPPNFLNWGGSGKSGPSSKEFLNKANNDAAQAIFAAAKTGDIHAVQALKAAVYDKDTGSAKGDAAVVSHPSQHIKGYAQQVINEINYQMNPPKRFRFDGGHPLHSLNAAYPAHQGAPSSAAAQKLGKFIVLGDPGVVKLADLGLPASIKHSEGGGTLSQATYAKQAQSAISKMPATQQQAIQSYTGSSYHSMNGSLWSGNPSGAAKAAGEALKTLGHDIAPGTVLSRKISVHGADLDQLLAASGKILQEPAIMSTSIRPSSWSGNVHLKLHVGPGVKGLWVGHGSKPGGGALSKNSGEDEMILPPGTRLMIMSVKQGGDADGFGKNGQHVIEAVVLPT